MPAGAELGRAAIPAYHRLAARPADHSPAPPAQERICRIILLTDGHHNHGRSPGAIARDLKAAGVCIDCIGIGGSPNDVDEPLLKAIASRDSDGRSPRHVFIGDADTLIEKFEQLAGRITR